MVRRIVSKRQFRVQDAERKVAEPQEDERLGTIEGRRTMRQGMIHGTFEGYGSSNTSDPPR